MISKINNFKRIIKALKPYSATLIGGSFDPFNFYYYRVLECASRQSRPLIVIIHPDDMVALRRGFILPNENCYKRAKNVSNLDFVDWVIISKKLAHDPWCLKLIQPKIVIFQRDNPIYIRKLLQILSQKFPKIIFKTVPFEREFKLSRNKQNVRNNAVKRLIENNKNPIAKRLILLAQRSKAPIGKISSILMYKDKIIAEESNSVNGEHAEILILNRVKLKKDLENYTLYTLIPPCIICAKFIVASKIKKVYYLYNYGDNLGIEYLKNNNIKIKKL